MEGGYCCDSTLPMGLQSNGGRTTRRGGNGSNSSSSGGSSSSKGESLKDCLIATVRAMEKQPLDPITTTTT